MERPEQNEPWPSGAATPQVPVPIFRRLRGYAFDPSVSTQMDTAMVNEIVFKVRWEELSLGPTGEYIEVVDTDPANSGFWQPIDLDDAYVLASDGLTPSEGNPQFHQQMVYAVAMTTIENFERALGRVALWAPRDLGDEGPERKLEFVRRLRIYPHALRQANAYYSPEKKALLFGYFPATECDVTAVDEHGESVHTYLPGGWVFACLSHDVVAHETVHALLDGMHRRYLEPTHPDTLAFHEAFADIVALFQRFTFPEVLRHQITRTRGDLRRQNMLGQLAQQFGRALGSLGALRDAIGEVVNGKWQPRRPDPEAMSKVFNPHERGSILVAAVFDAFQAIYDRRAADLYRIASAGTGELPAGQLHPDLVNRLADEAAKASKHVLRMCIRALDYCPPVDITFGDFLRAVITADSDLVRDDDLGYRVAFIEAFQRRGIYPRNVRTLSVESLRWPNPTHGRPSDRIGILTAAIDDELKELRDHKQSRSEYFERSQRLARRLHALIARNEIVCRELEAICNRDVALASGELGIELDSNGLPAFEVHSVRPAQRVGPDGDTVDSAIVVITQERRVRREHVPVDPASPDGPEKPLDPASLEPTMVFRGGVTLIFNFATFALQYAIGKGICDHGRLRRQREFRNSGQLGDLWSTYFGTPCGGEAVEPFALLHRSREELAP